MPKSVLFVCMGNICRSPAGEGVLLKQLQEQGLEDQVRVDSAGTLDYHVGDLADVRMRRAAEKRNISLPSRARQVRASDLNQFDLVIAMDRDNLAELRRLQSQPSAKLCLFSDFLDDSWPTDVPDPYYGNDEGFEYVLDMIQAGTANILSELLPSN